MVFSYLDKQSQRQETVSELNNVHGKDYTTAQDETTKSGHSTRPEGEETFLSDNTRGTIEAVLVLALCFNGLHSCLDRVQRHSNVSETGISCCIG